MRRRFGEMVATCNVSELVRIIELGLLEDLGEVLLVWLEAARR